MDLTYTSWLLLTSTSSERHFLKSTRSQYFKSPIIQNNSLIVLARQLRFLPAASLRLPISPSIILSTFLSVLLITAAQTNCLSVWGYAVVPPVICTHTTGCLFGWLYLMKVLLHILSSISALQCVGQYFNFSPLSSGKLMAWIAKAGAFL